MAKKETQVMSYYIHSMSSEYLGCSARSSSYVWCLEPALCKLDAGAPEWAVSRLDLSVLTGLHIGYKGHEKRRGL